ncbi:flagellar export protein FliJ [Paenibacillus algorifonticola]|uniref:Flagellar FliJ protein n=1 Tax=Paenibacillus sp. BIHB 4019 TaxID=1870819 RepID=A0A1B2DPN6_9BACL|nr:MULTISPECIES: flagellar export protein FliJ [unclassified Paenibacillus]ANY69673.1 flagellar export protein FliJ [Paenibacillus sp. BIHB 4019]KQO04419.1 flagellar export protein FliJ [Paenibacillus sp. Leaf72]
MGAFRYSYQKIVDLKTSEKTQAEWILSSSIGELQAAELTVEQLRESRAEWEQKQHQSSQSGVSLAELQTIQQYVDYLDSCIEAKRLEVKRAQKVVEQNRIKLSDKMQDEKVWLKAKDNEKERFRYAMQLKEQNELDEMATVRFMVSVP